MQWWEFTPVRTQIGRYPLEKQEVMKDPNVEKTKRRMSISRVCVKINYPEISGGRKEDQEKEKSFLLFM